MADYASTKSFETATRQGVSETTRSSDLVWAYAILRLSFGANIMLHGVSRLLAGHAAFLAYLSHYFEKTPLVPASVLPSFAWVLPPVETLLGLLLVVGLFTRFALIAGALVLAMLVAGTNLAQDWNVAGLQLIYAFLYCYLLVHRERNVVSIDGIMSR